MELDFAALSAPQRYKLLAGFVVPRPIALVTTQSRAGVANAAPFSFFNVFGSDPASVVLGIGARPDGTPKDTTRNIRETGEFVVNLVDEAIAEAMNLCAIDFPPEMSEIPAAGFTLEPSQAVAPQRLAESPAVLECRLLHIVEFNATRSLILGEVVWMRARDEVIDRENLRVSETAYHPVGRLHGDFYSRQNDRFAMKRPAYADWKEGR